MESWILTVWAWPSFGCLAVFVVASALLAGRPFTVRRASPLLAGRSHAVQGASLLLAALWLAGSLLGGDAGPGLPWLLTAWAETVALALFAAVPTALRPGRRPSPARPVTSAALLALAALAAVGPWLTSTLASPELSWIGLPRLAASDPLGLPWLELVTLGLLLGTRRRNAIALGAAGPALASLGTARFGLLPDGLALQGFYLAGFALGLAALGPDPRPRAENEGPVEVTEGRDRLARGRLPGWLAWAALGVALAAGLLLLGGPGFPQLAERTREALAQAEASALVLALAAGALALRFSAWTSPAFRLLAWRAARGLGAWRARLRLARWRWALVALAAGTALVVLGSALPESIAALGTWTEDNTVLLGTLVILVVLLRSSHRIRCEIFVEDFNGDQLASRELQPADPKEKKAPGAALATSLRHELASIATVHRTIDEALPAADGRMPRLEVTVEDVGAELEGTVGPLQLSKWTNVVPFLLRATGLLRGPHLRGTFHREGRALVLTVELSGGGKKGSWRVSEDVPDLAAAGQRGSPDETAEEMALAHRMVREMAYRIAASQASLGSPRWEAVRSFTEGLRHYRNVRLTDSDRDPELREAERCFREALQWDKTFTQGHYNLGVVYSRLGELDAALSVLRQAIAADPSSFSPHLAVAMAYFDRAVDRYYRGFAPDEVAEDFLQSRVFAGRAIALAPHEPRPWNVYGAATICWAWRGMVPPGRQASVDPADLGQAADAFRIAAALSWRRLCRGELAAGRQAIAEAKLVTLICLENLAETYFERGEEGDVERSADVLREALRLAPRKPSLHLALGKVLASRAPDPGERREALVEAENELYDVHADGLALHERAGRWAWLLAVHRELRRLAAEVRREPDGDDWYRQREGYRRAWHAALDTAAPPEELLMEIPPANESRDPSGRSTRYRMQVEILRGELRRPEERTPLFTRGGDTLKVWDALDRRLEALAEHADTRSDTDAPERGDRPMSWKDAQSNVRRARAVLFENPEEAVRRLQAALKRLRRTHSRQVRDQGLHTLLARAYLRLSKEKPGDGEQIVTSDPLLPASRSGCLHCALDYALRGVAEQPESALRHAVLAEVYSTLEDYSLGDPEWRAALGLGSPPDLLGERETLEAIYESWNRRIHAAARPDALRDRAIEFFDHLRKLLESAAVAPAGPSGGPRKLRSDEHGWLHHFLGRLEENRTGRHAEAAANLAIARANGYPPPKAPPAKGPQRLSR